VLTLLIVAAIEVVGVKIAAQHQPEARPLDALAYALIAAGILPLAVRHRFRVPAYVATLAATVAYAMLEYPYGPVFLALLLSMIGAVRAGHRIAVWISTGVGYLLFVGAGHVFGQLRRPGPATSILVAAWIIVAIGVAEKIRVRIERFAEIAKMHAEQQRARAEQQRAREEQERRQASEERLRIARELHDVLGHHLSLINVQAGVGLHLMDAQPGTGQAAARAALETIKQASAEALGEVRAVLGVLRPKDEAAPRAPAPSLANLATLVDPAGTAVIGEPVALPPEVDRAAYRIVQESLTNVRRHAGAAATARVTIRFRPDALEVSVVDDGAGVAPAGGDETAGSGISSGNGTAAGNGIAGMRARADALGGSLRTGPGPSGGFAVHATLPLRPPVEEEM
jgi:signal transduction histidine kinase